MNRSAHHIIIVTGLALILLGVLWVRPLQPLPVVRAEARTAGGQLELQLVQLAARCGLNRQLHAAAYLSCAQRAYGTADFPLALAGCDAALHLAPHDGSAYLWRGHTQLALQNYDQAIASYDQAIAHNVDFPTVHATRAFALARRGALTEATAGYELALNQKAQLYLNQGVQHLLHGRVGPGLVQLGAAVAVYRDQALRGEARRVLQAISMK